MRRKLKPPLNCTLEELGERYQYNLDKNKQYYYNNKEAQLERNEKWRELNPEKYKESCKKASKKCSTKNRKKPDWTWPKNDEDRKQRKKDGGRKYYLENREKLLKYQNNYNKINR